MPDNRWPDDRWPDAAPVPAAAPAPAPLSADDQLAVARALEKLAVATLASVQPPAPTVDLAAAVRARIEADELSAARRRRSRSRRVVAAAAAVVTVTAGAMAATSLSNSSRSTSSVAAGRGRGSSPVAAAPAGSTSAPTTTTSRHTTLAAVRNRLGFTLMVPAELGTPDTVIDQSKPGFSRVVLVYGTDDGSPRVQVAESTGTEDYADIADAALVRHDGFTGFWYQAPPRVGMVAADGNGWLSGHPLRQWNTLLWQASGVTIRLDSKLPLRDALALASSMTPLEIERTLRNLS